MADRIADQCADVVGSNTGEMFYKCTTVFTDYTPWAGPFFSGVLLGAAIIVVVVALVVS